MTSPKLYRKKLLSVAIMVVAVIGIVVSIAFLVGWLGGPAHSKAEWYTEALTTLETKYNKIQAAIVYHERFESWAGDWADLRINSSPEALLAYQNAIKSEYFIGKEGLNISPENQKILPLVNGCYVGFFPGWGDYEDAVTLQQILDFETLTNKSVAFVAFSNFWGENYSNSQNLDIIANYGAVPLLRFMPWGDPYWQPYGFQENYSLQKIINGDFDPFLIDWANVIINYGKPVMATFGVEMNGDWFAWSGTFQGGSTMTDYGDPTKADGPERYVDAFQHVIEVFNNTGATNITWYFHPNHESWPNETWNSIEAYYPGDDYIDWIGVSVYGPQSRTEEWQSFQVIMDPIYNLLITKFPNKPLMIPEWGIREP
ncbi:MAG TPA: glycosyl hydrolase [Candidatus Deferrimicrobium sp.]|nr:glycosyl hydrolase [Candidatus Deferrimicrobium sp.]